MALTVPEFILLILMQFKGVEWEPLMVEEVPADWHACVHSTPSFPSHT